MPKSKKLVVAPTIPADSMIHLSKDDHHVCGGDVSVSVNYELKWDDYPASEWKALFEHCDRAKNDPDYAVICSNPGKDDCTCLTRKS